MRGSVKMEWIPSTFGCRMLARILASRRKLSCAVGSIWAFGRSTLSATSRPSCVSLRQVELLTRVITVGKSKTQTGEGRAVPLNKTAARVLSTWAQQFPGRKPEHCVFPSERVGFSGSNEISQVYGTDPTTPITSWKVAWTSARRAAEVQCRFHDLRHTCITRLLEAGVPLSVVASLMGWSPATTTRMAKRYAHFGDSTQRRAMETLDPPTSPGSAASDEQETVQ